MNNRPSSPDNNLPIAIISTDFDGTIFAEFENPPIPDRLVQLLGGLQARGVKWVINTGRDMSSLQEALGRARLPIHPDALVLVEREIYYHQESQYVPLAEWNDQCMRAHEMVFVRLRQDLPRLLEWIHARYTATIYEDTFSPFCLIADNPGDAEAIHAFLDEYCREVPHLTVVRNDVYARLAHADYNKGSALTELARRWGVGPERVLAAGDHLNDLPMLQQQHARYLVTNANAMPEVVALVRRQQGFVSLRSHGHGVVEGLEHFLAGK